jgi:hypothetical protein
MAQSHSSSGGRSTGSQASTGSKSATGSKSSAGGQSSGGGTSEDKLPGGGKHSPAAVTHHLKGMHFPASREELLDHAKKSGAGQEVLSEIEHMKGQHFATMADVMKAFGQTH